MSLADLRHLPDDRREAFAARVQVAHDFDLPRLTAWNWSACRKHRVWHETQYNDDGEPIGTKEITDKPFPGCRDCGIHFRRHQRIGIAWLYLKRRALLADTVGSGKTAHGAGLVAMLAETGELAEGRAIICTRAAAVLQWHRELHRMVPGLVVEAAVGTKAQRTDKYLGAWHVLVISPQTLINDHEMLLNFPIKALVVDDVDPLRNRETRTAYALRRIGRECEYMVVMTGTPLQKRLHELHAVLEPLGGREVFGSEVAFRKRYVREEPTTIYNHKTGRKTTQIKIVGYKNVGEFSQLIRPMVLRRTAADIDDVDLPAISPNNVFLDLYPRQRAKYEELRKGLLRVMKDAGGGNITHQLAQNRFHYGMKICAGLAALGEPDEPETSVKFDWLLGHLGDSGDLEDEKVVVFAHFKDSIRALTARMERAGIGHVVIWGEESSKVVRQNRQDQFWDDPSTQVLIGTSSIEQSLNLQCARHLVNVDQIMNPARMEQLAGRIRRDGSAFRTVYVHNLLTNNTQEARYLDALEREQALIDAVWDERSELFDALSPLALAQLITG